MKITLKEFQKETINQLIDEIDNLNYSLSETKSILLEAPTGSGKTIILAKFIQKFLESRKMNGKKYSFIWFTPGKGKLHLQNKDKIAEVLLYSGIQILHFAETIKHNYLLPRTVTVLNWEKIARDSSNYYKNNEIFDLHEFIQQTKQQTTLIAIIDEEHYAKTTKTKTVIDLFNPNLIIRTSATPDEEQQHDVNIKISLQKVVNAELIKKGHKLNEQLNEFTLINNMLGDNLILLQTALQKRKELWQIYQKEGSLVNPLIIVQLPNERGEGAKKIRKETLKFFIKEGINLENKLLAIDLSEEKANLKELKPIRGQQIVIITKQTITHGWDCPRAQILVKLRGKSGKKFNIQTLGRICRVPEPEKGYYQNNVLNFGYVYTWDDTFEKKINALTLPITKSLSLKMKDAWKNTTLPLKIDNQKIQNFLITDEEGSYLNIARQFNNWFRWENDWTNISAKSKQMKKFLSDFTSTSLEQTETTLTYMEGEITGNLENKKVQKAKITLSYEKDGVTTLEKRFNHNFCYFLAKRLNHKNRKLIKNIFEYLFNNNKINQKDLSKTDKEYLYDFAISQNKKQETYFYCFLLNSRVIWLDLFKNFYSFLAGQKIAKWNSNLEFQYQAKFQLLQWKEYAFKIPPETSPGKTVTFETFPQKNNNLYQNFILPDERNFSQPEIKFINQFLESLGYGDQIDWWYRNVENEKSAWKIVYVDRNQQLRNFYPDFILKIKDNIWIIEIKDTSNLDQNNPNKFQYLKDFCLAHHLKFAFVMVDKNKIKFNNTQWNDDFDAREWKSMQFLFET